MKLITGANGFLGSAIVAVLEGRGVPVRGAVRALAKKHDIAVGDIGYDTNWAPALEGVDTVVHTAARVHNMKDSAIDQLSDFRKVNVGGTLNLARQAVRANVKRFIFISSIKVNGEVTLPGESFAADDQPGPIDSYATTKLESEVGLRNMAKESGIEVVIIRPPLVYGPGVKANFRAMIRWVNSGMPSPLGAIHNKRSFVALDNLVDLIATCIEHPAAANQTFVAGDGEDISTAELIRHIGQALGKQAILVPVPEWILKALASLVGKRKEMQRLCGSLQVDISKTRKLLEWEPPISVDEGLRQVVEDFKK